MNANRRHPVLAAGLLVSICVSASAQNQVHVVDEAGGPGSSYTTIQPAIDAASDGDVVLIRTGSYPGVTIDDKSISLVADVGGGGIAPRVVTITIQNLSSFRRAVVRGLHTSLVPSPFTQPYPMTIQGNAGPVLLEGVVVDSGATGVRVLNSANVMLTRCLVQSQGGAVTATASTVHVYDSFLFGGNGNDAFQSPFGVIQATPGSTALVVDSGKAILSGSTLVGGNGGHGVASGLGCTSFGPGGQGLTLTGVNPFAFLLDSDLIGGFDSEIAAPCSGTGTQAPGLIAPPGSTLASAEKSRSLVIESPIREGGGFSVTVGGVPGEPTFLLVSIAPTVKFGLSLAGTLVPAVPFNVYSFLVIPQYGTISMPLVMPSAAVPPGIDVVEVFAQILVPGALGKGVVGSSTTIEIVDGAL